MEGFSGTVCVEMLTWMSACQCSVASSNTVHGSCFDQAAAAVGQTAERGGWEAVMWDLSSAGFSLALMHTGSEESRSR